VFALCVEGCIHLCPTSIIGVGNGSEANGGGGKEGCELGHVVLVNKCVSRCEIRIFQVIFSQS
jgi:hypothetical protein